MAEVAEGLAVTAEDVEVFLKRLHHSRAESDCPAYRQGSRAGRRWARDSGSLEAVRECAADFQREDFAPGSAVVVGRSGSYIGSFVPPADTVPLSKDVQYLRSWGRGFLAGVAGFYEAVRERVEPDAIVARAECLGLRVQIRQGLATLFGDLDRAMRADPQLAGDFTASRAEITAELSK